MTIRLLAVGVSCAVAFIFVIVGTATDATAVTTKKNTTTVPLGTCNPNLQICDMTIPLRAGTPTRVGTPRRVGTPTRVGTPGRSPSLTDPVFGARIRF
jgi:hypothetical protein